MTMLELFILKCTLIVAAVFVPLASWTHLKIEKRDITIGDLVGFVILGLIPIVNIAALLMLIVFGISRCHKKVLIKAKD